MKFALSLFAITMAATVSESFAHEFTPLLDQVYGPDQRLEMMMDTWEKYMANLDFDAGFQKT